MESGNARLLGLPGATNGKDGALEIVKIRLHYLDYRAAGM
jgi:hypothetical protein